MIIAFSPVGRRGVVILQGLFAPRPVGDGMRAAFSRNCGEIWGAHEFGVIFQTGFCNQPLDAGRKGQIYFQ
ncbi:MAG: hypothetical protein WA138_02655 [Parvibaculum sp.]